MTGTGSGKMKRLLALLVVGWAVTVFAGSIDLVFVLDSSRSISDGEFNLAKNGLAAAIGDSTITPQDGSVSVTVVLFANDTQQVAIAPVRITTANVGSVVAAIRAIRPIREEVGTQIAPGIRLAYQTILAWPDKGSRQVMNVITDGVPWHEARNAGGQAADEAMAAGIEIINGIGVGIDENGINYLWGTNLTTDPGLVRPRYEGWPDPARRPKGPSVRHGFVWVATSWENFPPVVRSKILSETSAGTGYEGNICYVKGVTRDSNGEVVSTGNLFLMNLSDREEQQLTNFAGGAILNPSFTSDGKEVVFTSNAGSSWFSVYRVPVESQAWPGVFVLLSGDSTSSYRYASLSPDKKLLVMVCESGSASYLMTYNLSTRQRQIISRQPGMTYSHPVFLDGNPTTTSTRLIFLGTRNGIQNIYRVDVDGQNLVNLTDNSSGQFQYGRLLTGVAAELPTVIYAKRQASGFSWSKWDVYLARADGGSGSLPATEVNLTNTPEIDEYDPCFYGNNSSKPLLLSDTGDFLYSAAILGTETNLWQAPFNIFADSNRPLQQLTDDTPDMDKALVNWGISPSSDNPTALGQTCILYVNNGQIWRVDFLDDTKTLGTPAQITNLTTGDAVSHLNISGNGASIVYDLVPPGCSQPASGYVMNANGTQPQEIATVTPEAELLRAPVATSDGHWVFYVKGSQSAATSKTIYVKKITETMLTDEIALTTNIVGVVADTVDLYDPAVSPDNNQIAFSHRLNTGPYTGNFQIWTLGLSLNQEANPPHGKVTVPKTLSQLIAGNSRGLWSDRYPSYSPDGQRLVFVSDRDGTSKIYTMDARTGTDVRLFGDGNIDYTAYQEPVYPVYSPVDDGSLACVMKVGGQRHIVLIDRQGNVTDTGLGAGAGENIGEEISWSIRREAGTMFGSRLMQQRVPPGSNLIYTITIDVDEMAKPSGYVLNDIMPAWTVNAVWVDGTVTNNFVVYPDSPYTGMQTLKLTFADASGCAGNVSDHQVKISVNVGGTVDTKYAFSGYLVYINPVTGENTTTSLTGNSRLLVANPYLPTDIYDENGDTRKDGEPAVIHDADLLYTINQWKSNRQLILGYGPSDASPFWPSDTANWDEILVRIISFWANSSWQGGYCYNPAAASPTIEIYWVGTSSLNTGP